MRELRIDEHLLRETFEVFARCGNGQRECVVYWLAAVGADEVVEVLHPTHTASPYHYEVEGMWLSGFFAHLRATNRTAVAQVHTHGGRAFHSKTDDQFPLVPARGFVSLVVPAFGLGSPGLDDAFVAILDTHGWVSVDPADAIAVMPDAA